jgi:hypothetical protein
MDMGSDKPVSKMNNCTGLVFIALESKEYCFEHFLAYCCGRLDMLEPLIRGRSLEAAERTAAHAFLLECSDRVLLVCLDHEDLNHLERSRLLEILTLSEDLQQLLRRQGVKQAEFVSHAQTAMFDAAG